MGLSEPGGNGLAGREGCKLHATARTVRTQLRTAKTQGKIMFDAIITAQQHALRARAGDFDETPPPHQENDIQPAKLDVRGSGQENMPRWQVSLEPDTQARVAREKVI